MLIDFPTPPLPIHLQLDADDVNIYSRVKQPIDAEIVPQPCIDKAKCSSTQRESRIRSTNSPTPGKNEAATNHQDDAELFGALFNKIQTPSTHAYTNGSVIKNPSTSSCAVYIPDLNISESWRLSPGSSIFSAELHGIWKALSMIYASDSPAPEIHLFTDSSVAIKAIAASDKPTNRCISEIRNLLSCLKSSGSTTTLYWIPSSPV